MLNYVEGELYTWYYSHGACFTVRYLGKEGVDMLGEVVAVHDAEVMLEVGDLHTMLCTCSTPETCMSYWLPTVEFNGAN